MKRRSHALRRRYGHSLLAVSRRGMLTASVDYKRASDRYSIDFSWPEIDSSGHISRTMKHHLIKSIPAAEVLVRLTDVSKPTSRKAIDEAVRMVVAREADVRHIESWLAQHEGGRS